MNILFVCTGNVFRSVSAEYCLRDYLGKKKISGHTVSSAGTRAYFEFIHPVVRKTLKEYGIVIRRHHQTKLSQDLITTQDLVVAMAAYHQAYIQGTYQRHVPLFNEVAKGEHSSVWDVNDLIPWYFFRPGKTNEHIIKTVQDIHDSIPGFVKNMDRFVMTRPPSPTHT